MKHSPALLSLVALCLSMGLTGCLEFKEQTLALRHDVQQDTLRIFQDYHGIFGTKGDKLDDEEQQQLQSVLTTERTFFFTNWVYEINKTHVKQAMEKSRAQQQPQRQGDPAAESRPDAYTKDEIKRAEQLGQLVVDHVKIENGTFYFDSKRQLCATQKITITQWSKVLAAGNAALRDMLRHETEDSKDLSAEEKTALLSRIEQQAAFVVLRDNALSITLPVARARYESLTEDRPGVGDGEGKPTESMLAAFKRQGGKISYADHAMTIRFSAAPGSPAVITLPVSGNAYNDHVVEALKENKRTIEEKHDVAKAMREFLIAR